MVSYITSKTFPQKLDVSYDDIEEIVSRPLRTVENSQLLKDDPKIIELISSSNPNGLIDEFSKTLSQLRKSFNELTEEDLDLVGKIKDLSSFIGTVRPASDEEEDDLAKEIPLEVKLRNKYSSYFVGLNNDEIKAKVTELISMGVTE